jgi:hypothetical protein
MSLFHILYISKKYLDSSLHIIIRTFITELFHNRVNIKKQSTAFFC